MKPKPLHRSVVFWSGIFLMVFIVWAWTDSLRNTTSVGRHHFFFSHCYGGGVLSYNIASAPPLATDPYFETSRRVLDKPNPAKQIFPPSGLFFGGGGSMEDFMEMQSKRTGRETFFEHLSGNMPYRLKGDWSVFIPHWLVMLCVALPWSGLLVWRGSRLRQN